MSAAVSWLRLSRSDVAITVAVIAWSIAEAAGIEGEVPVGLRLAFALITSLAMVLRNRFPITLLIFAFAAFAFDSITQVLPIYAVTPIQFMPITTYAAAAQGIGGHPARFAAICIAVPIAIMFAFVHDWPVTATDLISLTITQSVAAVAGWAVYHRRAEAARQAEQLRRLRDSAPERLSAGLEAERLRLARELRVIVARTLATMEQRLTGLGGAGPAALRDAARAVQAGAAGAMDELQRLLGVLHDRPGVVAPVTVEAAAAAAQARGWPIELQRGPGEATPGATLAAGRVLEELLAGAPAEAALAPVRTSLTVHEGGLRLRVRGTGPAPGTLGDAAARGGLRERVRLHGGRLRLRSALGRWTVDAVLPAAGAEPDRGPSPLVGDLVVVAGAALVVADDATDAAEPWALVLCGALFFVLPLLLRRRLPLLAPPAIGLGLIVIEAAGLFPGLSRAPLILALLGAGSAAMHVADPRTARAALVAVVGPAVAVNLVQQHEGPPTDTAIILFMAAMAYAFGRLVREQVERTARARAGELEAAAELDERLRGAIDGERRAVARDLHDVVAHGVSLIGVLAGAADAQAERDPERARGSLAAARDAIGQARVELERLTLALAAPDTPEPAAGGLADLQRLVEDARRGGQAVTLQLETGAVPAVQQGVAASAYRIAQEALTNARKHAAGAAVTVAVARADGHLTVDVVNDPPAGPCAGAGTGNGLAGMRERARLLGGELSAGATPAGGFRVLARLPLAAEGTPAATPG